MLRAALSPGGALSALSAYRRFIVYKLVWMSDKGKHDKIPVAYTTGQNANAHDAAIQTDWSTAIMAAERLGREFGVGYVFTAEDKFFFLDIDNCLADGKWSEVALRILGHLQGAAVEVSVSGKGLHVFGRGAIPAHGCKNIPLHLELYHEGRFVALTGTNAVGNAGQDCSAGLAAIVAEYFPPTKEESFVWSDLKIPESEDKALLDRMLVTKSAYALFGQKATFADLWFANEPVLARNYPDSGKRTYDASSADMALAQHLAFWTRKDCARMWRLMWTSKLRRPKWDDRPEYVRDTIITACARQVDVLPEPMKPVQAGAPLPPGTPLTQIGQAPIALCLTTDQANAKRIDAQYGRRIMHSAGGWYGWDGSRWVPDMNYVWGCAQKLSTMIRDEAIEWRAKAEAKRAQNDPEGGHKEDTHAEDLEKYIKTAESRDTKASALAELSNLCSVEMDTLDSHSWYLNTLSGVVDLRNGQLLPHDSSLRLTKIAPVKYDPNAKCPMFEKFVAQIMREEALLPDLRVMSAFIQRWFGYCATGQTNEQKFAVHYGSGGNGKTTLIDTVASILGPHYASEAAPGMVTGKTSGHPTDIADLRGRRMVTSSETKDDELMKEDFIKRATGGDRLKGRHMRQDFFEFIPTHKLQLLTNHRPRIMGTDYGMWRRVMLVPYLVTFGSQAEFEAGTVHTMKDLTLAEKLKTEREGILAWVVRGAVAWHQGGLREPAEVLQATNSYRADQDMMAQFVSEQCEVGVNFSVPLQGTPGFAECLYPRYQIWSKDNGMHALGIKRFENDILRVVKGSTIVTEQRTGIDGRTRNVRVMRGLR